MRILYFSDTFLPKIDGITVSIKNFSELLSLRGHEFIICAPAYGQDDFERLNDKIKIERFLSVSLPSYPDVKVVVPSRSRIKKIIKQFQPDLIHIHTPGMLGLYALNVADMLGIPVIGTYHTLVSEQEGYLSVYRLLKLDKLFLKVSRFDKLNIKDLFKLLKTDSFNINKKVILKLCNYFYDRCDLILSPSHLLKDQLLEFGIKKPVKVISNGLDLARFQGQVKQLNSHSPKLLHVGRISYEKNCDVVIQAFKLINEKLPESTLTIIGDGPALGSLKVLVTKLGLDAKVTFTGLVPHTELHTYYPKFDLFVTASTMETQGLVVLEAIACGLPAVGVKAFAIPELIKEGKNGYNAKPFQHTEMAELALKVLGSPELYSEFSKNSLEVSKDHDLDCVTKMETTYSEISSKFKKKNFSLFNLLL